MRAGNLIIISGDSGVGKSKVARALQVVLSERSARDRRGAIRAQGLVVARTCSIEETRRRTNSRGDRTLEEAEHGYKHAGLYLDRDITVDTALCLLGRSCA